MDPLSGFIALLKPQSSVPAGVDAGGNWAAVQFDDQSGRIECYAVTSGACWLSVRAWANWSG